MTVANVKAYPPSGQGAAQDAIPARPPLTGDIDVDACVIGGSVAGLTAARELAQRGWSVAVLEAERIPWSAVDRSAGIVVPGFAVPIDRIVERVGLRQAKELWALASGGGDHVRRTARESMQNVRAVDGHLAVARSTNGRLRDRASLLRDEFGADVEFWSTNHVRSALQSPYYFQALHFPTAFRLNPLAYVHGLAAAVEQAGARIFEDTRALRIDAEGVRKRVETASARVRAGQIVLAGGKELGKLVPLLRDTVVSVETFAAVTAPLGERLRAATPFMGSVAELDGDACYHPVDSERLLLTGRMRTRAVDPQRMSARLRGDINHTFPHLGAVGMVHAWSAPARYAIHGMPHIGQVRPGLWLADAFGRRGMNTSAMAGLLIAGAITDADDRWRLFSSYGLSWNGGWAGRALIESALWTRRLHARLSDRLAGYRSVVKKEVHVSAHTEAPSIVPRDEMPMAPQAPQPAAEPVLDDRPVETPQSEPVVAAVEIAAPELANTRKPSRPKRTRKAAPKSPSRAKKPKAAKATPLASADVIVVRKAPKRRIKPGAAELPALPASRTDPPDSGSS